MSKINNWLKLLKIDPIPILLKKAPLPVRYAIAERFFPEETELLSKLQQEFQNYKPRVKLLNSQQPDGLWKLDKKYIIEERRKAMLFLQQLKNMAQLLDFGCTKEMPAIQKGIITLLKMQKSDGKFPLLYHHHGFALWLLVKYGLSGNPFVEKGFRWIAKRQRPDGGWLSASMVPSNVSVKSLKSGIWTTLFVCQAFSVHTRLRKSSTCQNASKFVLDNFLESNTTILFPEPDAWNYLYVDYTENGLFRGGTLRFVETLSNLPDTYDHPKSKKAVNWLIDNQLPSGLFPAIAGKSTQGDYNVTLRVITALKDMEKNKS
ncbi:MAG: terpene cyclase/mutase family protein [Candidatus Marinimicrobia bacterium]|nr:terpene cyclase/mutase family protein [Candidatus Neomarinimicrobiota bacterium]